MYIHIYIYIYTHTHTHTHSEFQIRLYNNQYVLKVKEKKKYDKILNDIWRTWKTTLKTKQEVNRKCKALPTREISIHFVFVGEFPA